MNTLRNPSKFLTQRSGMTHAQWQRVQTLRATPPRYLHVSATVYWSPDPRSLLDGMPRPDVPAIRKGETYDRGINQQKRFVRNTKQPVRRVVPLARKGA